MAAVWFVLSRLARDRAALLGLVLILALVMSAVFAPILATHPEDVLELHPAERLRAPSAEHWLGPGSRRSGRSATGGSPVTSRDGHG